MDKYVLTGSSCCFKSSIGDNLKNFMNINFIKSDSDLLSDMRHMGLVDYNFYPRILFKGYLMNMVQYLGNSVYEVIFERSMIDQLVYARIMSTGWFDLDTELDYNKVLNDTEKILNFEKSCHINKYYILENCNEDFLHKIIDSPDFENSRRYDSYYTVDDYIKLRKMFHDYYLEYLDKISANYKIITLNGDKNTTVDSMIMYGSKAIYNDIYEI